MFTKKVLLWQLNGGPPHHAAAATATYFFKIPRKPMFFLHAALRKAFVLQHCRKDGPSKTKEMLTLRFKNPCFHNVFEAWKRCGCRVAVSPSTPLQPQQHFWFENLIKRMALATKRATAREDLRVVSALGFQPPGQTLG